MVLGLCNEKGGVGKTSMTLSIADYLATQINPDTGEYNKVLVIDNDPQSNTTYITLNEFLMNGGVLRNEDTIYSTAVDDLPLVIQKTKNPNIDTVANSEYMFEGIMTIDRQENSLVGSKHTRLKKHLEDVKREYRYDYVLIDFGPSINILTYMGFTACDKVVIVSEPGVFATRGIKALRNVIYRMQADYNPQLQIAGILLNKIEMHRDVTKKTIKGIQEELSDIPLFSYEYDERNVKTGEIEKKTMYGVPLNSDMQHSQDNGRSLFDHNPHSRSAKAVKAIVNKYILN